MLNSVWSPVVIIKLPLTWQINVLCGKAGSADSGCLLWILMKICISIYCAISCLLWFSGVPVQWLFVAAAFQTPRCTETISQSWWRPSRGSPGHSAWPFRVSLVTAHRFSALLFSIAFFLDLTSCSLFLFLFYLILWVREFSHDCCWNVFTDQNVCQIPFSSIPFIWWTRHAFQELYR